jgi:hypothetical protein
MNLNSLVYLNRYLISHLNNFLVPPILSIFSKSRQLCFKMKISALEEDLSRKEEKVSNFFIGSSLTRINLFRKLLLSS